MDIKSSTDFLMNAEGTWRSWDYHVDQILDLDNFLEVSVWRFFSVTIWYLILNFPISYASTVHVFLLCIFAVCQGATGDISGAQNVFKEVQ